MQILNYIKKKYIRLQGSRNVLKLNYFIEKNFRDRKLGNIGFDFSNKPSRQAIVQKIIDYKNYNSYLEIGTFHNELFNHINCDTKVGVDPVSGGTIRKTSDQFFKDNIQKFDCIFIDGLHYYSQVKKDIQNSKLAFSRLKTLSTLRFNCYPNQAKPVEISKQDGLALGCETHVDSGVFTILYQDKKGSAKVALKFV